jgi:hypothetical protein
MILDADWFRERPDNGGPYLCTFCGYRANIRDAQHSASHVTQEQIDHALDPARLAKGEVLKTEVKVAEPSRFKDRPTR